ncbi:MAG: hypothetical protein RIQ84_1234 [Pseudomonadota bacterium]
MKTFRQIILALALTSPPLAEAQLINLTKQLENLAGKIQENQTSSIEKPIQVRKNISKIRPNWFME